MNKHEFLTGLQEALAPKMNQSQIQEQVNYYNSYIDSEIANGRSESEVVSELGDPWIIAKNVETNMGGSAGYEEYAETTEMKNGKEPFVWTSNRSTGCWIVGIVLLLTLFVVLYIFVGFIKLLAPVLYPLIIVYLLYRMFRKK